MTVAVLKPLVYSYVRFSTPEQRKGTGQARQEKLAMNWCKARNLTLCRNYADLGVSAFKGRNAEYGELARFLSAVEEGKIARGSTLLVENLDRLSRQNLNKAVELFLRIVNSGIRVVTLSDGKEYTADKLELPELMLSLLIFARANDESKMKSQRKAASWRFKREAAQKHNTPIGGKTPIWIKVEDGSYKVIEKKAEQVRLIFRDYIAGSGIYTLNKRYGIPKATIAWWLSNPAPIGTLRISEEGGKIDIPNHYPAIIDKQTWRKAQQKKQQRFIARRDGKTGYVNLFAGLLFDHKGHRFDVQRHYGFPSYVSPNSVVVQADKLESVLLHNVLPTLLVTTAIVEIDEKDPSVVPVDRKIATLEEKLVECPPEMMDSILTALRRLKQERSKLIAGSRRQTVQKADFSLVKKLITHREDITTRLAIRELIRDSVAKIIISRAQGTTHYRLIDGVVSLHDGKNIPFRFAYATRRLGYLVINGNEDHLPEIFRDYAYRDPSVETTDPLNRVNCDRVTEALIVELNKLPPRRQKSSTDAEEA